MSHRKYQSVAQAESCIQECNASCLQFVQAPFRNIRNLRKISEDVYLGNLEGDLGSDPVSMPCDLEGNLEGDLGPDLKSTEITQTWNSGNARE